MDNGYNLERFIDAQQSDYATALSEIKNGRKRSHWMWYIFPQIKGLGFSPTSQRYAIKDIHEAQAYLTHPVLSKRLIDISNELLKLQTDNATSVFGSPDDMKLRSSMTLFAEVPGADSVFKKVLEKYFRGESDQLTLKQL